MCKKEKKNLNKQLHKKCKYENNECDSLTSRHKIILDGLKSY